MKKIKYFLLAAAMTCGTVQAQELGKLTDKDCKVQIRRTGTASKATTDRNMSELAAIPDDSIEGLRRLHALALQTFIQDFSTAEKAIRKHQAALSNWNMAEAALAEIDTSSKALIKRGWCEYAESYLLLGSAIAKKNANFYQRDMQFQLSLARLYLESKRYDLTQSRLKPLLNSGSPGSPLPPAQKAEANALMGESYFTIKDYVNAAGFFEQSVAILEQNNVNDKGYLSENLYLLAASQYLTNEFLKGEKTFEKIKQLNGNDIRFSNGGSLYDQDIVANYKNGNLKEAIRIAEKRLEFFNGRQEELQTKIKALDGNPLEMKKLLNEQRETEHRRIATMLTLAEISHTQAQFDKARELYVQILASSKSQQFSQKLIFQVHSNLAPLYLSKKEFGLAEDNYLTAYEIAQKFFAPEHPSVTSAMANLAYVYKINGQTDYAEGYYLKLINRLKDESIYGYEELPAYYEYLGEIYLAKANFPDARKFYELAYEKNTTLQGNKKDPLIRCTKALITVYRKLDETNKAREMEKELAKFDSPAQKLKTSSSKKSKA
ncbi:tetratricopeptide repeat protein [Undibacterium sp. TC9W]|uniref:tetratricopeptide repeat protein n=1 Tax=Undibacterium sp. TC9W TaxID=3413053 RepID=UPI003BF1E732